MNEKQCAGADESDTRKYLVAWTATTEEHWWSMVAYLVCPCRVSDHEVVSTTRRSSLVVGHREQRAKDSG
jgi:hypothetical protein